MKKRSLNSRLYLMYLIALFPLILFGFYKNGIELYMKGLIDVLGMFKPIIILLMGVIGSIFASLFRERAQIKKEGIKVLERFKGNIVESILLVAILPLKSSPLIVFIVSFVFSLFKNKYQINKVIMMFLTITFINMLFDINTFSNAYELSRDLSYNGFDLFLGLGSGGIFSTSILMVLIGLLFLSFNKLYKKEMVYSAVLTFLVLGIVPFMILGKFDHIFPLIFGYDILFIFVYIAPNLYSSSYTVKGQILSGIMIGLLTFILSFLIPHLAAPIAVLLISFAKNIIDRIFVIK